MPRFSIIIPAYNAEDRIRKVLNSVKQQSFHDYECIVVCDSCKDRTQEIVESYGFTAVPVEFHNDGLSRSKGLDLAQGEYVLFLDDDDWWLHEYVLRQLNDKLAKEPTDILCFSFIWKGIGYASPYSNGGYLYPSVWNKCWKREAIGDTRFPNVYSISDYKFHCRMMDKRLKITAWDMPMYYYNYLREGSISQQMGRTVNGTKNYWENH